MFKKIIQFFLGQPEGYISPADRFLEKLRHDNPRPSAAQAAEIAQYQEINRLRDGVENNGNS